MAEEQQDSGSTTGGESSQALAEGGAGNTSSSESEEPKDDGVDPMMKYLSTIIQEHSSQKDRDLVTQVFDENADGSGGSQTLTDGEVHGVGTVSKQKAQFSYETIFEKWNVDLTGEQELLFEKEHFLPKWKEYVG